MGSPLQMTEAEVVLAHILISSAKAGIWQPKIIDVPKLTDTYIKTAKEYLSEVDKSCRKKFMIDEGTLTAIKVARDGRFVLTTSYEENVIVLSTFTAVEYFGNIK